VRRGCLQARKEVKPGNDRGLEDPVWDLVIGWLLGAARLREMEGGRGGGLGIAEV